jgi:hypothetical protein
MKTASCSRGAISALPIPMLALMAALAMLFCACGGNAKSLQTPALSPSAPPDSAGVISQVLAAQAPDGVDAELWDILRNELVRELGAKACERTVSTLNTDLPMNSYYRGIGRGWDDEFMRPDGSGNGIVDIGDLSTIVMHYHHRADYINAPGKVADYNNDGKVSLGDVTALARSYGMSCSGFRTEYSTSGEDSGFTPGGFVSYGDYRIGLPNVPTERRLYVYPSDTANDSPYWMRVWAVDNDGKDIGYHTFEVSVTKGTYPPAGSPAPEILPGESAIITWDTKSLLMADGNQDGTVNLFDYAFLWELYGTNTIENPLFLVMDYYYDGLIEAKDLSPFTRSFLNSVGSYLIELSTESADAGFVANGTVDYLASAGFNANGFRYYEYTIASSPVGVPYWVRVTPVGPNGELGVPSVAVEFGGE